MDNTVGDLSFVSVSIVYRESAAAPASSNIACHVPFIYFLEGLSSRGVPGTTRSAPGCVSCCSGTYHLALQLNGGQIAEI